MADILSAVVGSAGTTNQQNVQDPVTQQLQRERLSQVLALFQGGGLYDFGGGGGAAYQPTDFTNDISRIARESINNAPPIDYSNLMSLDSYRDSFNPVTSAYQNTLSGLEGATDRAIREAGGTYEGVRGYTTAARNAGIDRNYRDYITGMDAAQGGYNQTRGSIEADYNAAIARGDYDLARTLSTNAGYAQDAYQRTGANATANLNLNEANYLRSLGINEAVANRGFAQNEGNLNDALRMADADAQRSLGTQDFNRARALELGIGTTGNYIDQIARPRLEQVMALQGLEYGGALPASIARATAEQAIPYLQSIENAYGSNQANTLNNLMGLKGSLSGQGSAQDAALVQALLREQAAAGTNITGLQSGVMSNLTAQQAATANQLLAQQGQATESAASGNRALGGQRLAATATAGNTYQNNISQLAQALMANNVTLEQAGISAESALGQQLVQAQNTLRTQQQQGITAAGTNYMTNANTFAQTLPAASTALSMAPLQMQGARAATLQAFQPLADFPRQLQEADLLRRQGLFTTAFTGIPFAPSTSTSGSTETANLVENLFG